MRNRDAYLVVDLEATCDDRGRIPREESEIIEIGAVLVDGRTLEAVDELQTFVRPVVHPCLTDFCTRLTTITEPMLGTSWSATRAVPVFRPRSARNTGTSSRPSRR
jgi:inhibitor of KinA sporulation pathway (predicted exonuclease)